MTQWTPVWHQSLVRSFMNGKIFSHHHTVTFPLHIAPAADALRIRFSNLLGQETSRIGSVTVRTADSLFPVKVKGERAFRIPSGKQIWSDPLELSLPAGSDIEIRIYYETRQIDCNMIEDQANWLKGDQTYSADTYPLNKPLLCRMTGIANAVPAMDLIEVRSEEESSCIVAFGDSITAMSKWTKPLASRLEKEYGGKYTLLNSGIAGNCLLYKVEGAMGDVFGEKGTDRFKRDVLKLPHVKTVIFALGVNDVSYLNEETKDIISEEAYINAVTKIADDLHEAGIRVIASTITPRLKVARTMGKYTQEMEDLRLKLNAWIRSTDIFDGIVDQELAVRDEDENGYFFREGIHMGDHLHPNETGGVIMADAFDLKMLTGE